VSAVEEKGKLRLDKWLWHARFCKTRSLAQKLTESGHVKLNGTSVTKAAQAVKPGDELELVLGPYRKAVRVVALGVRRGPAPEAQALYAETRPPERLDGFLGEHVGGARPEVRPRGDGRPTKKDRRDTDRLKGME